MTNTITQNFESIPDNHAQELLKYTSPWQDMFQKGIYQNELKSGNIKPYFDISIDYSIPLDENRLWKEESINRVISEWVINVPIFKFDSIGHCLCFYGTIFFKQYDETALLLSRSLEIKLEDKLEEFESDENWQRIAKFLFHQITKTID
jgi:hypothetical protein